MNSYIKRYTSKKGQYIPKDSKKYVGSYPIIVRSSWERMFFQWLDANQKVVEWKSEPTGIRYHDPVRQRSRRYYPDVYAKILDKDGRSKEYIIEIKPAKEIRMPRKGKKSKRTMRIEEQTFVTNMAKFKAASEYCKKMGMEFKVLTEKDLFT